MFSSYMERRSCRGCRQGEASAYKSFVVPKLEKCIARRQIW